MGKAGKREEDEEKVPEWVGFNGPWEDQGYIDGTVLTWQTTGDTTDLKFIDGRVVMVLGGKTYAGQLTDEGLLWTDGDVWKRPKHQLATSPDFSPNEPATVSYAPTESQRSI